MSYAKYTEDNLKISQERQVDYLYYREKTPRKEEYIPYAVRYHIPPPARTAKQKRTYACGY